MRLPRLFSFLVVLCAGCSRGTAPSSATSTPSIHSPRDAERPIANLPANSPSNNATLPVAHEPPLKPDLKLMAIVDQPGLQNLIQITDGLYSGSQPEGDLGFESLAELGIKTIVSVDGAVPDLEPARNHGLRYVHVPIGYDGVPEKARLTLTRLVREVDQPIYIHCHHGNHRGPAAAAIACVALGATDGTTALEILNRAGTSKDYPGLWRDVEAFAVPESGTELPELVDVAEVKSLAAAMARMDRSYDLLKLCRDADWSVPPGHPDLVPALQALQVREGFREIARNLVTDRDAEFQRRISEAEVLASALESAIRSGEPLDANQQIQLLEKACKQCHARYRN